MSVSFCLGSGDLPSLVGSRLAPAHTPGWLIQTFCSMNIWATPECQSCLLAARSVFRLSSHEPGLSHLASRLTGLSLAFAAPALLRLSCDRGRRLTTCYRKAQSHPVQRPTRRYYEDLRQHPPSSPSSTACSRAPFFCGRGDPRRHIGRLPATWFAGRRRIQKVRVLHRAFPVFIALSGRSISLHAPRRGSYRSGDLI